MEKKKDVLKRLDLKKREKIIEIKKIVNSLLLNKKAKIKQIEKINSIPQKDDVYEAMKIYDAFDDKFVEYRSSSKKDKSIPVTRYPNNIREHLGKLINDKRKKRKWKIQLIMKINFISSKNFIETRDMHSKSDNTEIMVGVDNNEIIKNLFNSLLQRYQERQ